VVADEPTSVALPAAVQETIAISSAHAYCGTYMAPAAAAARSAGRGLVASPRSYAASATAVAIACATSRMRAAGGKRRPCSRSASFTWPASARAAAKKARRPHGAPPTAEAQAQRPERRTSCSPAPWCARGHSVSRGERGSRWRTPRVPMSSRTPVRPCTRRSMSDSRARIPQAAHSGAPWHRARAV